MSYLNDKFSHPRWVKISKSYTDFATAALTNDISIYTLPINGYIHDVKIVPVTAFSGGSISAVSISIGNSTSLVKYSAASDVFTGNLTTAAAHTPLAGMESTSTTGDIRAAIIAVGALQTLNNLTSGTVNIYLLISILN